jgi:hypothetical protein
VKALVDSSNNSEPVKAYLKQLIDSVTPAKKKLAYYKKLEAQSITE